MIHSLIVLASGRTFLLDFRGHLNNHKKVRSTQAGSLSSSAFPITAQRSPRSSTLHQKLKSRKNEDNYLMWLLMKVDESMIPYVELRREKVWLIRERAISFPECFVGRYSRLQLWVRIGLPLMSLRAKGSNTYEHIYLIVCSLL